MISNTVTAHKKVWTPKGFAHSYAVNKAEKYLSSLDGTIVQDKGLPSVQT